LTKHYHKYRLKNLSRDKTKPPYYVYVCIKQDCSHHIRIELIDGKISECNRCDRPFQMSYRKLKGTNKKVMERPHCDDCTKSRVTVKAVKKEKIKSALDDLSELMENMYPKDI